MDGLAREAVTGVVLAGGLGRRMGADRDGDDKGLRTFRGRALAAHAIERLAPQVGPLAISANRNPTAWRTFGLPVWADRLEGFAGPLAGLHAGMANASTPWLATVPCDAPFLPRDLVARLSAAVLAADAQVALARAGGRTHPVFALVERGLRAHLEAFLEGGGRKVADWCGSLRAVEVPFDDAAAFLNLNTAEELAAAEGLAAAEERATGEAPARREHDAAPARAGRTGPR